MKKYYRFKGKATLETMLARQEGKLLELFAKYNLPCRKFAFGDTALSIEFEKDKVGYSGFLKREHLTGNIIVHVNIDLALLENVKYKIYKTHEQDEEGNWSSEATYNETGNELSQRLARQNLNVSDDDIEKLITDIREKLSNIMTIESEADTFIRFAGPQVVDFDKVFE